jgi:hypothetical protein
MFSEAFKDEGGEDEKISRLNLDIFLTLYQA